MSRHGFIRAAAAVILAAQLGGCGQQNDYYDVAPSVAFDRLRKADIEGFRDARQCGMLIYFHASDDGSGLLTWEITTDGDGDTVGAFRLRITPSGQGSAISIEVPKGPNGAEIYDGGQTYTHPALMQPLRPALRELVDSAIEQRPYDWHRLPDPLNTDGLCGSMRQNFEASGTPYQIDDPSGMTHEQAEAARANGDSVLVEHDHVIADTISWSSDAQ